MNLKKAKETRRLARELAKAHSSIEEETSYVTDNNGSRRLSPRCLRFYIKHADRMK